MGLECYVCLRGAAGLTALVDGALAAKSSFTSYTFKWTCNDKMIIDAFFFFFFLYRISFFVWPGVGIFGTSWFDSKAILDLHLFFIII